VVINYIKYIKEKTIAMGLGGLEVKLLS